MAYELEDELAAELEDELEDEGELEEEGEEELEDEQEDEFGAILSGLGSLLGEGEDEGEFEDELEDELEDEISPVRKIYPDAMMEHLGELAAEAETEDEAAEQFLPLIGMAASKLLPVVARAVAPAAKKLLPKIARAVHKAAPHLTKHIAKVARTLHRNPQTRHLLKVVPAIARKTVGHVARQAAHGRRVTPHSAVRTLARHVRRILTHPGHRKHALQHHRRLEHKLHRRFGRGMAHPHGHWGRGRHHFGHLGHRGHRGGGLVPRHAATKAIHRAVAKGLARGVRGVHHGGISGGHCACPQYCRCCGQVLR